MMYLYHHRYHNAGMSIRNILNELEIDFLSFDSADRVSMDEEGVYLLTVPSLNIQGGNHQVVVEMLEDGDWRVFDPAKGRHDGTEFKKYYTSLPGEVELDPLAVIMAGGYIIDAFILRKDLPQL